VAIKAEQLQSLISKPAVPTDFKAKPESK